MFIKKLKLRGKNYENILVTRVIINGDET